MGKSCLSLLDDNEIKRQIEKKITQDIWNYSTISLFIKSRQSQRKIHRLTL